MLGLGRQAQAGVLRTAALPAGAVGDDPAGGEPVGEAGIEAFLDGQGARGGRRTWSARVSWSMGSRLRCRWRRWRGGSGGGGWADLSRRGQWLGRASWCGGRRRRRGRSGAAVEGRLRASPSRWGAGDGGR